MVDTTNFSPETNFPARPVSICMSSSASRGVAPNVILYEFTVHDPTTFTADWTAAVPMTTIKGPIFEYACNEGNYGMADMLRGARVFEQKRAEAVKTALLPSQELMAASSSRFKIFGFCTNKR